MKIKLKKQIFLKALPAVLFIAVMVAVIYISYENRPITSVNYANITLNFRADLREASKIPIDPSDLAAYLEVMNAQVKNVTIVFVPATKDQSLYALEAFELSNKLAYGFLVRGFNVTIEAQNVSSYEGIYGRIDNPIIMLVHPEYSNETSITLSYPHLITIKAKTANDFDLVVAKFLMAALRIDIE